MERNKIQIILLFIYMNTLVMAQTPSQGRTLLNNIDLIKSLYQVHFVYDASLNVKQQSIISISKSRTLEENLNLAFANTNIRWEKKNNYILLRSINNYTYSGYIYQPNGESLMNVTIFDLTSKNGTLSDHNGFFSLNLSEGKHQIRFSYVGYQDTIKMLDLKSNIRELIYLQEGVLKLNSIEIVGNLNSPLNTTQTGKISLNTNQLKTEYSLLSSPDLVKTLQNQSGVSSGMELMSGLYVHGGGNDENLFLLDGSPLYQVNHLGGLFSAFNTDIIKNVDFYKSGFPARYGGRLSSVIDIRTKDGSMTDYSGSFSIGLLDGRIQYEGPIKKNKTSFIFGLRRSWMDLISTPVMYIYNKRNSEKNQLWRYNFQDFNAKITHRFSDNNRISLSFYTGLDNMKIKINNDEQKFSDDTKRELYNMHFKLRWGNLNTTLNWNYQLSPHFNSNVKVIYSRSNSLYSYTEDEAFKNNDIISDRTITHRMNKTRIDDWGYRIDLDYKSTTRHHFRFGTDYLYHMFRPQNSASSNISENNNIQDSISVINSEKYRGNELAFYAEDEIRMTSNMKINLGLRYALYILKNKTYHSMEPRIALMYQLSRNLTIKTSYTKMSQFAHLLSNTYLNLPTDSWVPSTSMIKPMYSQQYATGVYINTPWSILFSAEGYYKSTTGLLEYDGGNELSIPSSSWEKYVQTGKGRSYGAELSASYQNKKLSLNLNYTLSWSKQRFDKFYHTWYPSKYDNRHRLFISTRYQLAPLIDISASWTYHSGNKATLPTQYVIGPGIPDIPDSNQPIYIYDQPNNISLPAYHRLDLGFNFRKRTKRGHEQIWNISIYNAYCRMNAFYSKIQRQPDGSFKGKAIGILPIIPSFSYTLNF